MATRLLLLTYNLWTLFVRVVKEQGVHTEAVTRRDEPLLVPVKLVESGRQKTLKLDVCRLARPAPQLHKQQTFERSLLWHTPLSPENRLADPLPCHLNCGI